MISEGTENLHPDSTKRAINKRTVPHIISIPTDFRTDSRLAATLTVLFPKLRYKPWHFRSEPACSPLSPSNTPPPKILAFPLLGCPTDLRLNPVFCFSCFSLQHFFLPFWQLFSNLWQPLALSVCLRLLQSLIYHTQYWVSGRDINTCWQEQGEEGIDGRKEWLKEGEKQRKTKSNIGVTSEPAVKTNKKADSVAEVSFRHGRNH